MVNAAMGCNEERWKIADLALTWLNMETSEHGKVYFVNVP